MTPADTKLGSVADPWGLGPTADPFGHQRLGPTFDPYGHRLGPYADPHGRRRGPNHGRDRQSGSRWHRLSRRRPAL